MKTIFFACVRVRRARPCCLREYSHVRVRVREHTLNHDIHEHTFGVAAYSGCIFTHAYVFSLCYVPYIVLFICILHISMHCIYRS